LIDADQELIDVDQELIDVDRKLIDFNQKSININRKCLETRTLDGSQPRQLLLWIVARVDLRMRLGDAAVFVDDVGDPFREFVFRRLRGTVGEADPAIGVAKELKGEFEFLGEVSVAGDVVETGT